MVAPLPPETDGLRFLDVLGGGGFATVFEACRLADARQVAVKVAHEGAESILEREAAALRAIGPPIVPEVLGTGSVAGRAYIALAHIGHPTLDRLGSAATARELASRALPFLDCLAALHDRGWIHLDLKPANIAIAPAGAVLLDLGTARRIGEGGTGPSFAGTAAYMSPEQCAGEPLCARSDIYSAGIVLYELIAGRVPFAGSDREVHQAHAARRPAPPSRFARVASSIESVVLRCLEKDRSRRFAAAAELRDALRHAIDLAGAERCAFGATGEVARFARSIEGLSGSTPVPEAVLPRTVVTRPVAVLLAKPADAPLRLVESVESSGGTLARVEEGWCAFVFDASPPACPLRNAALAGQTAIANGSATSGHLDTCEARLTLRPDGSTRHFVPRLEPSFFSGEVSLSTSAASALRRGRAIPAKEQGRWIFDDADPSSGDEPIGRGEEIEALLADSRNAGPSFAAVLGPSGTGRSSLATHLARRLASGSSATVVWTLLGADSSIDGTPQAFQRLLGLIGAPGLAASVETASRPIAVEAAGNAIRDVARRAPLCIVLDDAEQIDDLTLDSLEYAGLAEAGAKLWVCAFARPEFARVRPGWGRRAQRSPRLHIGPLDEASAGTLCRALLLPADPVPQEAVDRLVAMSGGVPRDLVDLVGALKNDGLVREHVGGRAWYVATDRLDEVPATTTSAWLAEHEVRSLPPDLAAACEIASLLGPGFTLDDLSGVVGELDREGCTASAIDPDVALRRLASAGTIRGDDGVWVFRHALLRDAIGQRIDAGRRIEIHRAASRYFSGRVGERALRRRAHHLAEAGEVVAAREAFLQVAEGAAARHSLLDAEAAFTKAVELLQGADAATTLRAWHGRGSVRYRIGRLEDALQDLERARRNAVSSGRLVDVLLDLATALDWASRYDDAAAAVAEAAAGAVAGPAVAARLLMARGRVLVRAERWSEAAELLEASAASSASLGPSGEETRVISLLLLAAVLPMLDRAKDAETALERVIVMTRANGDRLHLASALNNRRNARIAAGDLAGALRDLAACKALGRESGMAGFEYVAEYNTAELLYQAAEPEGAAAAAMRARAIEERHPEITTRASAALLSARIHAFVGDRGAALRELDVFRSSAPALSPSESILADMIRLATAGGAAAEWDALLERSARQSVEQEPIEVLEFAALAAGLNGDRPRAETLFDRAEALCHTLPTVMHERLRASRRLLRQTSPLWCTPTAPAGRNSADRRRSRNGTIDEAAPAWRPTR